MVSEKERRWLGARGEIEGSLFFPHYFVLFNLYAYSLIMY